MLTLDGEKMSKSTGKFFLPMQMFEGTTDVFDKAYSPTAVRFFMMQCHYRSTLDLSSDALSSSEKALKKLLTAVDTLNQLSVSDSSDVNVSDFETRCYAAMNDDFNTPMVCATLFDMVKQINGAKDGKLKVTLDDVDKMKQLMQVFLFDILGIEPEVKSDEGGSDKSGELIEMLLKLRAKAKADKDFALSDQLRDDLAAMNIVIKDTAAGTEWSIN